MPLVLVEVSLRNVNASPGASRRTRQRAYSLPERAIHPVRNYGDTTQRPSHFLDHISGIAAEKNHAVRPCHRPCLHVSQSHQPCAHPRKAVSAHLAGLVREHVLTYDNGWFESANRSSVTAQQKVAATRASFPLEATKLPPQLNR